MKRFRRTSLLGFGLALVSALIRAEEQEEFQIENLTPESEFTFQGNVWTGTHGVTVRYGTNSVLTADNISFDQNSGHADASGNVNLQVGGQVWHGELLSCNLKTKEIAANGFRFGMPPVFLGGTNIATLTTNQVAASTNTAYVATNAFLTTDDVPNPAFRIKARSLKIIPGKSVEARNATVRIGNVPVMYFPYYRHSLTANPSNFEFTPGYRSLYGPFLLSTYNVYLNERLRLGINVDYRQKRGVAGGPEFEYDLKDFGKGLFSYYFMRDEAPGLDAKGVPIRRYRSEIQFSHQVSIQTNLTVKVVANDQSDPLFIHDFFDARYRRDPQPKSFVEANKFWSNFSLSALAQQPLNDFYQSVDRIPDVRLSGFRQQLGVSPFYYQSETSVGYLRFNAPDPASTNYSALRADTYHELLLPYTFFGWLNVTPRAGARFTHYGETEGDRTTLEEQNRSVFNTGAEITAKASRVWGGVRNDFWDLTGLRHILQPSVNYVFVPTPSKAPRELPQFDSELPSLRLLPIDFPDYNAIDSIDSQNVLRLSLRNKVQTKRREEIDNLVNWALYTDWRLDPRDDQYTFADFYSDLDIKPRSWLMLSSEIRYNQESGHLRAANHEMTIMPNDVWSLSLGHRYFREDPAFGLNSENNLFRSSVYYRFNDNWGLRLTHHFEARDGTLEEQYYTIYRDLRSWTAALTLRVRDNRVIQDDITVAITFSLKAFPRYKLDHDRSTHSSLIGGLDPR